MANVDQGAAFELDEPKARGGLMKWVLILLIAIILIGVGAGAWYFFLGGKEHFGAPAAKKEVEAPLPHFLDLKAFVISVSSNSGTPHFVQMGPSLQLPSPAAAELITPILPQVQDAMRQTVLTFKTDDLQTPDGVDKLRRAMTNHLNEVLLQVLGPERIAKVSAEGRGGGGHGGSEKALVANIFFATLIIE